MTTFHELHAGRFVMPNAWDAGSAVLLGEAGFPAIATTSAGIAFSMAKCDHTLPDGAPAVSRDAMFARMQEIAAASAVPVNGDLEDGYGAEPAKVAETITLAREIGLAGGNIEDFDGRELYEVELAVERIVAAREAAGADFVLTARTDGQILRTPTSLSDSIDRANRFRAAGADCLYVPGVNELDTITTLVREIDGPLNVVIGLGTSTLTVAELQDAGVTRISLGGSIARAALGFIRRSAQELATRGTITFAADQIPQAELNQLFADRTS
ncbi:isocitrate lyase/phosphoenolpyruvate mutase family protein [Kribbella capetownensis]|uniref:Isocitrate lyase/phosphoenolpyruvate mutase family protein n=1 Tax=Kribbella capetownensis TaxID=1572659 RepID=A0A4R0JQP8_9ACTN|nr:isocitrate lyase/phosphoenolpyruvate mutase family protein [Kribbella capetownensis]TCC49673.1 isocitrate lyase/phosphoenolpyruvate mutase family protein [Kribbella capetownensis]